MSFCIWGFRKGWRKVGLLLLVEYVFLLYCSTVFCRDVDPEIGHNFHPFWSYRAILDGKDVLLAENFMNVMVFVPVGILLGTQIAQKTQKGWLVATGVGLFISVSIEMLQFFLKRGFAEGDDVMHNVAGGVLGYAVFRGIALIASK